MIYTVKNPKYNDDDNILYLIDISFHSHYLCDVFRLVIM